MSALAPKAVRVRTAEGWQDIALVGPPGPQGPPGFGASTYIFTQSTPSAVWTVGHGLGQYPSVTVVDSGGSEVIPTIAYLDANTLTVTFGAPTTGKAYLN